MEMEEVKGLLSKPLTRYEVFDLLSSGMPDWCEIGSWDEVGVVEGFQVVSREVLVRGSDNSVDNRRDAIYQVGQIREVAGFVEFYPIFTIDMHKDSNFTDFNTLKPGVFFHRPSKGIAFELKLICAREISLPIIKILIKPSKLLNFNGLKAILSVSHKSPK